MKDYELDQVITNIAAIRVAMFTASGDEDDLHSRPLYTIKIDDELRIWFFSKKITSREFNITKNQSVNISYADTHTHTYISISGKAEFYDDPGLIDDLWDGSSEIWIGQQDKTQTILLSVEVRSIALWDLDNAQMRHILDL